MNSYNFEEEFWICSLEKYERLSEFIAQFSLVWVRTLML